MNEGRTVELRKIGAGALIVLIVAAILVGGWWAGWWLKENATNKSTHIFEKSYGAQSAYIEQLDQSTVEATRLDSQIRDPSTPVAERQSLAAQRTAVVQQACGVAARITSELPESEGRFVATNC